MELGIGRGVLGMLACMLALPLCGYAAGQGASAPLPEMRSVAGEVVHKNGYTFVLYRDIEYLGAGVEWGKADLYLPASFASATNQTFPVVMEIHGGGWVEGDKAGYLSESLAWELTKAGYALFSINYKLMVQADKKSGTPKQIAWPENFYDCKSALRFLRKYSGELHIQPGKIAVMGESAGGHLALLVGYTAEDGRLNRGGLYTEQSNAVAAVVNLYGITDVYRWGAESFFDETTINPAMELCLATPLSHVSGRTPPTLTFHGDADKCVPVSQGRRLHKLLDQYAVENEFVEVKGAWHAFPVIPHAANAQTDCVPVLLDFLGRHLK